ENLIGPERLIADFHLLRPNELGVAFEDRTPFQRLQRSLDTLARGAHNGILAHLHCPHIDAYRAGDGHAVVSSTARQIRRIGPRYQRLGRGAAGIAAGPTEKLALDDATLPPACH